MRRPRSCGTAPSLVFTSMTHLHLCRFAHHSRAWLLLCTAVLGIAFCASANSLRSQAFVEGWRAPHIASWGGEGAAPGKFSKPFGLTLQGGVLWVADTFNHRIQKLDTNRNFLGAVGSFGTGDGQFITPTWVSFDASGAYYVSETNADPQNPTSPIKESRSSAPRAPSR